MNRHSHQPAATQEGADISTDFYRRHASRYAEVCRLGLQSVYIQASHPNLIGDESLLARLRELVPGKRGPDAGCGAEARDVAGLLAEGYDIYGIDAVEENIACALESHPELAGRIWVADLARPLGFPAASFDFIICDAVIQHMEPRAVLETTLPEFARTLRPGGVLQLMFKNGHGVVSMFDRDYGVQRSFKLYDEYELLRHLRSYGMELIEAD